MKYLVTYDIRDRRRWYKIFKIMKQLGLNVQLSCFEIEMSSYGFTKLMGEVEQIADWNEDSIYFFPLSEYASGLTVKLGKAEELNEDKIL